MSRARDDSLFPLHILYDTSGALAVVFDYSSNIGQGLSSSSYVMIT